MKPILSLVILFITLNVCAQSSNETTIRQLLEQQIAAWNKGDVEGFMQAYWNSDSLMFIGKNGIVWGWQRTVDNYKKNYPDTAAMGKLAFDILQVKRVAKDHYFVVGKWMLKRSMGNLNGHYTLLWRKIKGQWKIVADHSS